MISGDIARPSERKERRSREAVPWRLETAREEGPISKVGASFLRRVDPGRTTILPSGRHLRGLRFLAEDTSSLCPGKVVAGNLSSVTDARAARGRSRSRVQALARGESFDGSVPSQQRSTIAGIGTRLVSILPARRSIDSPCRAVFIRARGSQSCWRRQRQRGFVRSPLITARL